jgi:hypothetical protein
MVGRASRLLIRVLPVVAAVVAMMVLAAHGVSKPASTSHASYGGRPGSAEAVVVSCSYQPTKADANQPEIDASHCAVANVAATDADESTRLSHLLPMPESRPLRPASRPVNAARSLAELQVSLR